ncbi:MAG: hypothetical protein FJW38_30020 [Acidobacteria bacterium]|nr:hypothetical protein [Acidobacteriota bacterium]
MTRIILTALACSAAALGAYFGGDSGDHWGGEVRYLYRFSDARLSGSGGSPKFNAQTNIMTGEILGYFKKRSAVTRPYVAFGGGIKWIRATGTESAAQPLGRIAALTNTEEAMAVASVGAGVKHAIGKRLLLRIDVRDYLGKRPNKIIAPAPGAKVSGFYNDIVASVSIGFRF